MILAMIGMIRKSRYFLFLFIYSLSSTAWAQKVPPLSLKQAVDSALKASPMYLTSKNQFETSSLEVKNAFAAFLPSLDLSSSHGVRGLNPDRAGTTAKTPAVSTATLALTENLYDNGESFKKNQIAKYRYELAKVNYQKTKGQIIRSVLLAYYRYNIALQNLRFTTKNYQELERLAKLVSNQFHQGMKTRKDYLGFSTRAQRGRLNVIEAEKNLTLARAALITEIGLGPTTDIQFDESIKPLVPKKDMIVDIDPNTLYESQALDLQQKISEHEVSLARRKFWPELNLVASATYGSSDYVDTKQTWKDNESTQWSVLANIKFNLIDWGVRSRNIQIAALNQNTSEQTAKNTLLQAQKDLEVFKKEVADSKERYQLAKELQKMEEDAFKLLERDYRSGQTTYLELITGLANLLDAQSRGQEADFNQADLYLRWKYYKGILSEDTIYE